MGIFIRNKPIVRHNKGIPDLISIKDLKFLLNLKHKRRENKTNEKGTIFIRFPNSGLQEKDWFTPPGL